MSECGFKSIIPFSLGFSISPAIPSFLFQAVRPVSLECHLGPFQPIPVNCKYKGTQLCHILTSSTDRLNLEQDAVI